MQKEASRLKKKIQKIMILAVFVYQLIEVGREKEGGAGVSVLEF
jgi:hypothetical protein